MFVSSILRHVSKVIFEGVVLSVHEYLTNSSIDVPSFRILITGKFTSISFLTLYHSLYYIIHYIIFCSVVSMKEQRSEQIERLVDEWHIFVCEAERTVFSRNQTKCEN